MRRRHMAARGVAMIQVGDGAWSRSVFRVQLALLVQLAGAGTVGAILLGQNDEWAVQRRVSVS